jgi:hypothetical protein
VVALVEMKAVLMQHQVWQTQAVVVVAQVDLAHKVLAVQV